MGNHTDARYYLRRGMDLRYLSEATRRHRTDVMAAVFPYVVNGGLLLGIVMFARSIYKRIKRRGEVT